MLLISVTHGYLLGNSRCSSFGISWMFNFKKGTNPTTKILHTSDVGEAKESL